MNSKNLYFTIFSLILLGFISSCVENSNKCTSVRDKGKGLEIW